MKIQKRARICLCVSAAILVIALVMSLMGYGINYGIDFAGGLNIQYDMGAAFDQADVETALRNQGVNQFTISASGAQGHVLQIRVPTLSGDEEIQTLQNGLEAELSQIYPDMDTDTATASYVGPVAGATLVRNAVISVLLASALMLVLSASMPSVAEMVSSLSWRRSRGSAPLCSLRQMSCVCSSVKLPVTITSPP